MAPTAVTPTKPARQVAPTPAHGTSAADRRRSIDDDYEVDGDDDLELEYADEARYNLATRVMSNGVEVIIAGDKSKTGEPTNTNNQTKSTNILRILQTQPLKPMTLAPSTLKNQMILMVPSDVQENYSISLDTNHFITKTCLTTYTYRTTYLQSGTTTVENREKVISNIATEERNYLKLSPTVAQSVTLSRTPEFTMGSFHTTYTYYNTVLEGELPLVMTSRHTVTNTITGPDDYIAFLQASEEATPVLETNTYYSRITLTKTLHRSLQEQVVSTANILTQVIVTESLPSRTAALTTAFDMIEPTKVTQGASPASPSDQFGGPENDLHIYATKTFLNTFTYFTTLLKDSPSHGGAESADEPTSTVVNFHTRVIENVITETVPSSLLSAELVSRFQNELRKTNNRRKSIVTLATLSDGHTLEITAMEILKPAITSGFPETLETITSPDPDAHAQQTLTPALPSTKAAENGPSQLPLTTKNPTTGTVPATRKKPPSSVSTTGPLPQATRIGQITMIKTPDLNAEEDSLATESEQDAVYVEIGTRPQPAAPRPPKIRHKGGSISNNNNRTKQVATSATVTPSPNIPGSVNQIIGSLNLNHLTALRPVFHAMAGLLHNNFRVGVTNTNNNNSKDPSSPLVESKHSLKNISAPAGPAPQSHVEQPIYIPVKSVTDPAPGQPPTAGEPGGAGESPQSLHIQPPAEEVALNDDTWLKEAASKLLPLQVLRYREGAGHQSQLNRRPLTGGVYEQPLLNGGIPISPGEVITANSDVIVGRPNGIQHPRVPPFNEAQPTADSSASSNALSHAHTRHPPSTTFYQHFIQHPYKKKSSLPLDENVILPFLKEHQQLPVGEQELGPHRPQQNYMHNHEAPPNFDHILKPPPLQAPLDRRQAELQLHPPAERPSYIELPPPPAPKHPQHRQPLQSQILKQHGIHAYRPPTHSEAKYHTVPHAEQPPFQKQRQNLLQFNQELQNNEILEIMRVPEVFSTDLPPETEFTTYQGSPASEECTRDTNTLQQRQQQHADGNTNTISNGVSALYSAKPTLLVDVQPSRVTNVLIPHDDGVSALVLSSTREPHRPPYVPYYSESGSSNNNGNHEAPAKASPVSVSAPKKPAGGSGPHLNHQKINFDTHAFSHNVHINVPPLTFKKDAEFPSQSDPVRGQIPSSLVQLEPQMPLVQIPLMEQQVQVNLTPNHVIVPLATVSSASPGYDQQLQTPENIGSFALQMPDRPGQDRPELQSDGEGSAAYKYRNNHIAPLSQRTPGLRPPTQFNYVAQHVSILENPFMIANELKHLLLQDAASEGGQHPRPLTPHVVSTAPYPYRTDGSHSHSPNFGPDVPHEGRPHNAWPTPLTNPPQVAPKQPLRLGESPPQQDYGQRIHRPHFPTKTHRRPSPGRIPLTQTPSASSPGHQSEATMANTTSQTTTLATIVDSRIATNIRVPPSTTVDNWNLNAMSPDPEAAAASVDQKASPSQNSVRLPPLNYFLPTPAPQENWTRVHGEPVDQPYARPPAANAVDGASLSHDQRLPTTTPAFKTPTAAPTTSATITPTRNRFVLPSPGKPFESTRPKSKRPSGTQFTDKWPLAFATPSGGFKRPQAASALPKLGEATRRPQSEHVTKSPASMAFAPMTPAVTYRPTRRPLPSSLASLAADARPTNHTKQVLKALATKSPLENAIDKEHGEDTRPSSHNQEDNNEIFDYYETSNPHNRGAVNTTGLGFESEPGTQTTRRPPATVPRQGRPPTPGSSNSSPSTLPSFPATSTTLVRPYHIFKQVDNIRPPPPPGATEAVMGLNPPPLPSVSLALPQPATGATLLPIPASWPYKTIYNYTGINRATLLSPPPQQHHQKVGNELQKPGAERRQPMHQQVPPKTSPTPDPQGLWVSSLKPPASASNVFVRLQPGEDTEFLAPTSQMNVATMSTPSLSSASFTISSRVLYATRKPVSSTKIEFISSTRHLAPTLSSSATAASTNQKLVVDNSNNFGHNIALNSIEDNEVTPALDSPGSRATTVTTTKGRRPLETSSRKELNWQSEASASAMRYQNRANTEIHRNVSLPHVLPTKFVTNTHILTVTSTETAVLTAAGKEYTKTLTKTQTATVLDTVTVIHTLLQPARITESHIILATAAVPGSVPARDAASSFSVAPVAAAGAPAPAPEHEAEDRRIANHKIVYHHNHKPAPEPRPNSGLFNTAPMSTFSGTASPSVEVVLSDAAIKQQQQLKETRKRLRPKGPEADSDLQNNSIFILMTDSNSKSGDSGGHSNVGIININPNLLESAHNINAIGVNAGDASEPSGSAGAPVELDYDDNVTFEFPVRDEEGAPDDHKANHVLLGGVLIATPSKSKSSLSSGSSSFSPATAQNGSDTLEAANAASCRPACKASRNELCVPVQARMRCVCRPGFARMFPDRPCKPTYTYAMQIPVHRIGHELVHFDEQLLNNESEDFRHLAVITHDAVDRMVMQSDFRDVYHGVHLTSFGTDALGASTQSQDPEATESVTAHFLLQLSDNSDERRLANVFKKYLRLSNYSIGGTELFTTKHGVESMAIEDFDECLHSKFHDCSENARCFNLQGTYTCSCQEGFADLSENPIYPGRLCSAELIGCEKCHYHGKCVAPPHPDPPAAKALLSKGTAICECYPWYTGASCQLNLKILLIALIAIGTFLSILLLFCLMVTCNNRSRTFAAGVYKLGPRKGSAHLSAMTGRNPTLKIDKRAMIKDSSSEISQNSLPYVLKHETNSSTFKKHSSHASNFHVGDGPALHATWHVSEPLGPSTSLISALENSINHLHHHYPEQSDRSLTVMIPRAKYHPSMLPQTKLMHHQLTMERPEPSTAVGCGEYGNHEQPNAIAQGNDVEHLQVQAVTRHSAVSIEGKQSAKKVSMNSAKRMSMGALVSAGFEVSATVSGNLLNSANDTLNSSAGDGAMNGTGDGNCSMTRFDNTSTTSGGGGGGAGFDAYGVPGNEMNQVLPSYMSNEMHIRPKMESSESRHESEYNNYKDREDLMDTMDEWLDTIHQTELTAEARSFDETTVQAPTKSMRSRDNQMSQTNDEANTMAERDIGSTFLLPHTHLYKPDRHESDMSGFDTS